MVTIFGSTNRRLTPEEAVAEGVKTLCDEAKAALGFANPAERLGSYPSEEEVRQATEEIGYTISSLKRALAAAEGVQRNLKKM